MNREAQILLAMRQSMDVGQRRALAEELHAIRTGAARRTAAARDRQVATDVVEAHLTPVMPHVRHTAATDWLGKVASTSHTAQQVHVAAKAEATRWHAQVHPMVRADVEEYTIQAEGYAQVWASRFGDVADEAEQSFMQQAMHLAGMRMASRRTAADLSDVERWCDQRGMVMKDFPDRLIDQAAASGDMSVLEDWLESNDPLTERDTWWGATPQPMADWDTPYTASRHTAARAVTKFMPCPKHEAYFAGMDRYRKAEMFHEGGPAGFTGCTPGQLCQIAPGTDLFDSSICDSTYDVTTYPFAWYSDSKSASRTAAGAGHPSGTVFGWPRDAEGEIACPSCGSNDVVMSGSNLGSDVVRGTMYQTITCNSCGTSSGAPMRFTDRNGTSTETDWSQQWGWKSASAHTAVQTCPSCHTTWPDDANPGNVYQSDGQWVWECHTCGAETPVSGPEAVEITSSRKVGRALYEIADEIRRDWGTVNFAAEPYLDAMSQIDSINDVYFADDARSIVMYFLNNAKSWSGPKAKEIKDELRSMVKSGSRRTASTCSVCGDAIASHGDGYHHDNGEKHDHEAKPSKESARRTAGYRYMTPDEVTRWRGGEYFPSAEENGNGVMFYVDDSDPSEFGLSDDDDPNMILASRRTAASDSDPHVILRVTNKGKALSEIQAYLYSGWKAQQVEDGTIYISGHDDGGGFGMNALRERLLSGLIGTEMVTSEGQGQTWASRRTAGATVVFEDGEPTNWSGIRGGADYVPLPWTIQNAAGEILGAYPTEAMANEELPMYRWADYDQSTKTFGSHRTAANMDQATIDAWTSLQPGTRIKIGFEESVSQGEFIGLFQNQNPDLYGNAPVVVYDAGDGKEKFFVPARTETPRLASRRTAADLPSPSEQSQNGYAESGLPVVDVPGAPENFNLGWIEDENSDPIGAYEMAPEGEMGPFEAMFMNAGRRTAGFVDTDSTVRQWLDSTGQLSVLRYMSPSEYWALALDAGVIDLVQYSLGEPGTPFGSDSFYVRPDGMTAIFGSRHHAGRKQAGDTMPGFYRDNLEWVPERQKGDMQSEKDRLFPNGIPLRGDLTPEQEAWLKKRSSNKRGSISLTNVGYSGENGVGTDPQGNRVTFKLSPKDLADLKSILLSDMAVNFSGVEIEESDIISTASKTAEWGGEKCGNCGKANSPGKDRCAHCGGVMPGEKYKKQGAELPSPSENSQNGYGESSLPDVEVGTAQEDSNMGWIEDDGSDAALEAMDGRYGQRRRMAAGPTHDADWGNSSTHWPSPYGEDLFGAANAAYEANDQLWFNNLSTNDLMILWNAVSGENFATGIQTYGWDDEVYEALADRGVLAQGSRRTAESNTRPAGAAPMVDTVVDEADDDADMFGGEWVHDEQPKHAALRQRQAAIQLAATLHSDDDIDMFAAPRKVAGFSVGDRVEVTNWNGAASTGTVTEVDANPLSGAEYILYAMDGEDPELAYPVYTNDVNGIKVRKIAMPAPGDLGVSVGDIFYNSWGYDQTNVDFYKVVRLTGAGVEVVPIGSKVVSGDAYNESVVADPSSIREFDVIIGIDRGDAQRSKVCRLRDGGTWGPYIVLSRDHSASKWDGTPRHQSGPYGGH
jgi:ssDNA-binding Zn-finger/Zn-ribbon topoisomerase 1